jgi:DNA-binding transcriptional ArsR family regulator
MVHRVSLEQLNTKQLEQLRALTEPIRLKLFAVLRDPKTVTEAASVMGVDRTSLYYHLRVLLNTGLVEEVEVRRSRNLNESVYKAVDRVVFSRLPGEDPGPEAPYLRLVMNLVQGANDDCQRSLSRGGDLKAAARRIIMRFKPESLATKPKQITEMMHEFVDRLKELNDDEGVEYSITVTHFEM